jgi:hypothetical protein
MEEGKYAEFASVDASDTAAVVAAIRLALDTDKFSSDEERLYALGWVLDRNKDTYIRHLKDHVREAVVAKQKAEKELKTALKRIEELEKPVPAPAADTVKDVPKKKVVIIRKKTS